MTRYRALFVGAGLAAVAAGGGALALSRVHSLEDDLGAARRSNRVVRIDLEKTEDAWRADRARLREISASRASLRGVLFDLRLQAKDLRRISRALMPGSESCLDKYPAVADVDGDGAEDLVYLEWIKRKGSFGRAVLGVCTDSGQTDRIPGAGQAELLMIIDVESDGRDEIFFGGTSCCAQIADIATFSDGRLRRVRLRNGEPLVVIDGTDPGFFAEVGPAGAAFGCEDEDDDGEPELIQVSAKPKGKKYFGWTRYAYRIVNLSAIRLSGESGKVKNDPEQPDVEEVRAVASGLTEPCKVKATG